MLARPLLLDKAPIVFNNEHVEEFRKELSLDSKYLEINIQIADPEEDEDIAYLEKYNVRYPKNTDVPRNTVIGATFHTKFHIFPYCCTSVTHGGTFV